MTSKAVPTMTAVEKLLSIAGDPLSSRTPSVNVSNFDRVGQLGDELVAMLGQKNGFYAFESALHVLPAAPFEKEATLSRWNSFGLWRHEYDDLIRDDVLFFAEDVFGDQFCLNKGEICSFDAETAEMKVSAPSVEAWAKSMLDNYALLTGYPLAHEWQKQHGPLPNGTRLMPKIPFVLRGTYAIDNLYVIDAVSGMKTRGNLARQIRDLPDGARVEFRVID